MYSVVTEQITERGMRLEKEIRIERMHIEIYSQTRLAQWAATFIKEQFPSEYVDWLKLFLFRHPVITARI